MFICVENFVVVRTQFEGFHYWKDAPDEVAFLRDLHRHIFHVEVVMSVRHGDRDVEVILLKRFIDRACSLLTEKIKREGLSCERIAKEIMKLIEIQYDPSGCTVAVLEDNENGGVIRYAK